MCLILTFGLLACCLKESGSVIVAGLIPDYSLINILELSNLENEISSIFLTNSFKRDQHISMLVLALLALLSLGANMTEHMKSKLLTIIRSFYLQCCFNEFNKL